MVATKFEQAMNLREATLINECASMVPNSTNSRTTTSVGNKRVSAWLALITHKPKRAEPTLWGEHHNGHYGHTHYGYYCFLLKKNRVSILMEGPLTHFAIMVTINHLW